jgi:hypothetical protein
MKAVGSSLQHFIILLSLLLLLLPIPVAARSKAQVCDRCPIVFQAKYYLTESHFFQVNIPSLAYCDREQH